MKLKTPVVGIPSWSWKSKMVSHASRHPNERSVSIEDFCYECSRHFEILNFFDQKKVDLKDSEYYRFQSGNGRMGSEIRKKISSFHELYRSIRKEGCKSLPIVTVDGCRLDGSHRLSILIHLGIKRSKINIAEYSPCFSEKQESKIRKQVLAYRRKKYGFK